MFVREKGWLLAGCGAAALGTRPIVLKAVDPADRAQIRLQITWSSPQNPLKTRNQRPFSRPGRYMYFPPVAKSIGRITIDLTGCNASAGSQAAGLIVIRSEERICK